jgi:hypothetical protein
VVPRPLRDQITALGTFFVSVTEKGVRIGSNGLTFRSPKCRLTES